MGSATQERDRPKSGGFAAIDALASDSERGGKEVYRRASSIRGRLSGRGAIQVPENDGASRSAYSVGGSVNGGREEVRSRASEGRHSSKHDQSGSNGHSSPVGLRNGGLGVSGSRYSVAKSAPEDTKARPHKSKQGRDRASSERIVAKDGVKGRFRSVDRLPSKRGQVAEMEEHRHRKSARSADRQGEQGSRYSHKPGDGLFAFLTVARSIASGVRHDQLPARMGRRERESGTDTYHLPHSETCVCNDAQRDERASSAYHGGSEALGYRYDVDLYPCGEPASITVSRKAGRESVRQLADRLQALASIEATVLSNKWKGLALASWIITYLCGMYVLDATMRGRIENCLTSSCAQTQRASSPPPAFDLSRSPLTFNDTGASRAAKRVRVSYPWSGLDI